MNRAKTDSDIAAIKQSVVAAEAAMLAVMSYLKESGSPTSEEAHAVIDQTLALNDCESPEGRVVGAGPASYEPHYEGEGKIEHGQPIVIDIYPRSKTTGWYADMTRTVCLSKPPQELQDMYNAVQRVLEDSASRLRPGASCDELQKAAVDQFVAMGYQTSGVGTLFKFAEGFVHSLGHGVGKEVHEEPFFGGDRGHVLQVGDVVTIEPGLYYKHIGGVRLEDMFLITQMGCEQLTTLPLKLEI